MSPSLRPVRLVSIQTTNARGGAEYANVDLLEALVARGHDVVLLTNLPEIAAGSQLDRARDSTSGPSLPAARGSVGAAGAFDPRAPGACTACRATGRHAAPALQEGTTAVLAVAVAAHGHDRLGGVGTGATADAPAGRPGSCTHSRHGARTGSWPCRREAGERSWTRAFRRGRWMYVPFLVDINAVEFDAASRARLRRSWGAGEQTLVVGCVSRFQRRKRNDVVIDAMARPGRRCDARPRRARASTRRRCASARGPMATVCASCRTCAGRWRRSSRPVMCSSSLRAPPRVRLA